MNCQEAQARISEYLDSSLGATQLAIVQSHLASCPSCQEEAALLKETIEQVAALPSMDPPLGFNQRIMARVRDVEMQRGYWERMFWAFRRAVPIHATALVAVGILGVFLWARQEWQTAPTLSSSQHPSNTTAPEAITVQQIPTAAESDTERLAHTSVDRADDSSRNTADRGVTAPTKRPADEQRQRTAGEPTKLVGEPPISRSTESAGRASATQRSAEDRSSTARTPESDDRSGSVIASTSVANAPQTQWGTPVTFSSPFEFEAGNPFRSPTVLEPFADYELTVRRRSRSAQGAQRASARESAPPRAIDRLMAAIPDHSRPQTIWVNVPKNQYEQFKKELDALGTIESELAVPLLREQSAARDDGHVRVKLTAVPKD
jgi:hypothetical protein